MSARDHLVGSDIGVVTAVFLGFAHSRALVSALDFGSLRYRGEDGGNSGVTTTISTSLSSDFTAAPSISTVVTSACVVVLSLGMESLLSELSASDERESGSSRA